MSKEIPTDSARQGRSGTRVLQILIAALLLAAVAWGVAEIYGHQAKSPSTQQGSDTVSPPASETRSGDPSMSKNSNQTESTQIEKNPAPQSSTGGDQPVAPPAKPTSP